ncbi:hypothetical protein EJ08DRAFT_656845 [Tothia fuscella]|uniref:Uncharacterized protein n=1 Tax=Tothia fuscella TaxID=1048955 RepID=A0A9P4P229_9PEZI|nr:hypothetical protein EJ08DRAFT_656845 [Tothia fuscella]
MSTETRGPETHSETITSWLPVTTAWPLHSGCDQSYWMEIIGAENTILAWDPGYGASVDGSWTSCLPAEATAWWQGVGANSETQIRLGPLVCPEAYYTATTTSENAESTFVACCPSGYSLNSIIKAVRAPGECTSQVTAGQALTYAYRDDSSNWALTTTSLSEPTVLAGVPINGYNFASSTPTTTATAGAQILVAASSSRTTDSKGPLQSVTGFPNLGLEAGAKAGVGVIITLLLIMLFGIAGIFHLRMRRRDGQRILETPEPMAPLMYKENSFEMEHSSVPPKPPAKDQKFVICKSPLATVLERHPTF